MRSVMQTYFAPNRTVADVREVVKNGVVVYPLKDFADAAREDLRPFIAR